MGSGVLPLAMATRLFRSQAPGTRSQDFLVPGPEAWRKRVVRVCPGGTLVRRLRRRRCRLLSWHLAPGAWLLILAAGCGAEADRAISTGQLRRLPCFHLRPIDVVVYHGSRRDLVLRGVSRLDAFSGYPVRT